jgi:predicted membrane channel-forming protein YqfA (hemolysin III family)
MKFTRARITLIILLIALADMGSLFLVRPVHQPHQKAMIPLIADSVLIVAGIAAQWWMRDKPRLRPIRLVIYILTLVGCMSLGLIIVAISLRVVGFR